MTLALELAPGAPAGGAGVALAVGVVAGEPPAGQLAALDAAAGGRLAALLARPGLVGAEGSAEWVEGPGGTIAIAAGLGPRADADADAVRTAAARAAAIALRLGCERLAWACDAGLPVAPAEQARAALEGAVLGTYDPGAWKRERPAAALRTLVLCGDAPVAWPEQTRVLAAARWSNRCRDLVNAGGNEVTPERFAAEGRALAARFAAVDCDVMGPRELTAAGMGGLLAVAQGSALEPRMVTLRYAPAGARGGVRLGLVGKAVTFDAGGLSLKPSDKLSLEKSDMAGGAAVLCALAAIAEAGLPVEVVAVLAACENMPGGAAYRPGDIVTIADGTTVEVTNTDAEGRLALADALVHARTLGLTHTVDVATLTGTTIVALGDVYGCAFANDEAWMAALLAAGAASGDRLWPWPLHRSYRRTLRSAFADLRNYDPSRQAHPVHGALFLERFAGAGPWAHLDVCGPSNLERSREDYLTVEGGTGFGVRLLVELAARLAAGGRGAAR